MNMKDYEANCRQATEDQGLTPVVEALKAAGFPVIVEQTGGFCMVATVYASDALSWVGITLEGMRGLPDHGDGEYLYAVYHYPNPDSDGDMLVELSPVCDLEDWVANALPEYQSLIHPVTYDQQCEQSVKDQKLDVVVDALRESGLPVQTLDTGGFMMIAEATNNKDRAVQITTAETDDDSHRYEVWLHFYDGSGKCLVSAVSAEVAIGAVVKAFPEYSTHSGCDQDPRFACVTCHKIHVQLAKVAGMPFGAWRDQYSVPPTPLRSVQS